ncbi:MAG: LptF/LptG family permease [Bacillota bacterium]
MKILTRYILKEFIGPLLFGIFAFTSLFMGFALIELLRDAEKYHFSLLFTLKLLSLTLPQYVTIGSSIAVLLAALLGIGKLTSHSETIAMRAGGLSYAKLAAPILIIGLLVSISGILLNEYLVPVSLQTYEKMKAEAIAKEASGTIYDINKILWEAEVKKLFYAVKYKPKEESFEQVLIQEVDYQGKLRRTILASEMHWDGRSWYFNKGEIYQYNSDSLYPITVNSGRVHYQLNLTPKEVEQINVGPDKKSISELRTYIQKFAPNGAERQSLMVELHLKFAIPFASFVFAILGTPLALRPQRRSNAAGFGLCIIYIILWYVLMATGSSMARAGSIPAFLGAWLPNIVLAGYGVAVFLREKS